MAIAGVGIIALWAILAFVAPWLPLQPGAKWTYEKTTPDFVARVWLGERYAGEHAFTSDYEQFQRLKAEAKAKGLL